MICTEDKKETIYREFYPKVSSYIHSHLYNKSEVEDITSEVFIKIYSSLEKYDESKASLSTWIYTITKNTVFNHYKKQKFSLISFSDLHEYEIPDKENEAKELLCRLNDELSRLPQLQQSIVILFYYFGLSHKEIAQKVGLSYANVRKQSSLAVAELKRRLL